MSNARCNPCSCPSPQVIEVPGAPGVDASAVAPGVVDPNGAVIGTPGQTYLNTATNSFWVKATGNGNTGWIEIVGASA